MARICISCKKVVDNDKEAVSFPCPVCGEHIIRCGTCRRTMVRYICSCGFEGP